MLQQAERPDFDVRPGFTYWMGRDHIYVTAVDDAYIHYADSSAATGSPTPTISRIELEVGLDLIAKAHRKQHQQAMEYHRRSELGGHFAEQYEVAAMVIMAAINGEPGDPTHPFFCHQCDTELETDVCSTPSCAGIDGMVQVMYKPSETILGKKAGAA